MRALSPGALATLASNQGIEPILIVEVAWTDADVVSYSDRVFQEYNLVGRLLEVNTFDSFVNVETGSNSATVTIKLDDTDGAIKAIFNNVDIQKRPVSILQWFSNLPISDAFLVFEGLINSPMVWDEGARTLSFEAITHLEDLEAGFSVEDGQFTNVPVDMVGKPWPMPFGLVVNMPALRIDDIPTGATEQNYGISDSTIATEMQKIQCQQGKQIAMSDCLSRAGADLLLRSMAGDVQDINLYRKGEELQQRSLDILNAVSGNMAKDYANLLSKNNQQIFYDTNVLQILNGWKFTQGVQVGVKIGKGYYFGVFSGDSFTVFSRLTEEQVLMLEPTKGPWFASLESELTPSSGITGQSISIQFPSLVGGFVESAIFDMADNLDFLTPTASEKASNPCGPPNFFFYESLLCSQLLGKGQRSKFQTRQSLYSIPAGSSVKPAYGYPIRYVVSIIPGTTVLGVSALGTIVSDVGGVLVSNGVKQLVGVPQPYWSVSTEVFGDITATILTVTQPLDTILGYDFGNQPYVTVNSPVGPNIMDVLAYFINTWATPVYAIDPTTFATVHAQVAAFPCNFYLAEKKNVFQIIKDLSYQSRIMTSFGEGTFEFLYLPQDATPVDSISESDVLSKSLTVTTTKTEDIVTQYKAVWQDDYFNTVKNIWVLQNNIAKYGLHKKEYNIQIYNLEWEVEKTALFWLLRTSNTFKILKCKLLIHKLNLEPLDTVSLAFTNNYVANGTVPGILLKADFNPTDYTIECEFWVPVLLGTMIQYKAANAADYEEDVLGIQTEEAGTRSPVVASGNFGGTSVNITTTTGKTPKVSASDQGFTPTSGPVVTTLGYNNVVTLPDGSQYSNAFQAFVRGPTQIWSATDGTTVMANNVPAGAGNPRSPGTANPQPVNPQINQYEYQRYGELPNPRITFQPVMAGQVQGMVQVQGVGQIYTVQVYPDGLANAAQMVNVLQLQLDPAATIPAGTWVIVLSRTISSTGSTGQQQTNLEYYMQVPVWLAPGSSPSSPPPPPAGNLASGGPGGGAQQSAPANQASGPAGGDQASQAISQGEAIAGSNTSTGPQPGGND